MHFNVHSKRSCYKAVKGALCQGHSASAPNQGCVRTLEAPLSSKVEVYQQPLTYLIGSPRYHQVVTIMPRTEAHEAQENFASRKTKASQKPPVNATRPEASYDPQLGLNGKKAGGSYQAYGRSRIKLPELRLSPTTATSKPLACRSWQPACAWCCCWYESKKAT